MSLSGQCGFATAAELTSPAGESQHKNAIGQTLVLRSFMVSHDYVGVLASTTDVFHCSSFALRRPSEVTHQVVYLDGY